MSEPILRLPQQFQRPLQFLRSMSDAEVEALFAHLEDLSISTRPEQAAASASLVMSTGDESDASESDLLTLIEFGVSTRALVARLGQTVEVTGRAVVVAYLGDEPPEDSLTLEHRVVGLLRTSYIVYQEKAARLTTAAAQTVQGSRCITDLRPVFAEGADENEVRGFLVLHMLELEVLDGDELQSLYFNVDSAMLLKIGVTVNRAIEKARSLSKIIENSGYDDMTPNSKEG